MLPRWEYRKGIEGPGTVCNYQKYVRKCRVAEIQQNGKNVKACRWEAWPLK